MPRDNKIPCGRTTGHGMSCDEVTPCGSCDEVMKLRKEVTRLKKENEQLRNKNTELGWGTNPDRMGS